MAETAIYDQIVAMAQEAGFSKAGIAPVPQPGESGPADFETYFEDWIERGYAGEMEYLKRRDQDNRLLRSSLRIAVPWARSVIVCAANYNADAPRSLDPAPPETGWIARYAWTGYRSESSQVPSPPSDYHDVLLARLKQLEHRLQQELGPFPSRCYVDTGPLVERVYALYAGIGWVGKNTCILDQQLGSWIFLGVILTSLDLEPDLPAADRCGSCTRCIEACPTSALVEPYKLDATRCISYLTIEKRGGIPEEIRSGMGNHIFGCDICQDVCPWNGGSTLHSPTARSPKAPATEAAEFQPRPGLVNPPLGQIASMTREYFQQTFRASPVKRAKYAGLRRNAVIAMGNSGERSFLPQLQELAQDPDPDVAEQARWAIQKLGSP